MDNIKYLNDSLIYQMSLGSKELFHSNVWAWLIEKDKENKSFVKVFFRDFDFSKYEIISVSREYRHRDIIIWLLEKGFEEKGKEGHYYLVIENKIKSLPSKEQLKGYTEDFDNNKLLAAVVTGISNTLSEEECCIKLPDGKEFKWEFVDYKSIAEGIRKTLDEKGVCEAIQDHNNIDAIVEYCDVVKNTDETIKCAIEDKMGVLDYRFPNLAEIRLDDVAKKLKGSDFLRYVRERLDDSKYSVSGYEIKTGQSFNNKKVTLDFKYSNWTSDDKPWFCIGVQIEGTQYRLIVDRNKPHECGPTYDEFDERWFSLIEKSPSMRNDFCKYIGPKYIFVYKYMDISEENNSYETLSELIFRHLEEAKKIFVEMININD